MAEISMTDTGVGRRIPYRQPLRMLISGHPWLSMIFMFISFALGTAWFTVLVTLLSTGFGLAITLIGIPILAATLFVWIFGAKLERWRVRWLLGVEIEDPYRVWPREGRWWEKLRALVTNRYVWQDLLYLFLLFPIGTAEFVIATTLLSTVGATISAPIWYAFGGRADIGWAAFDSWFGAMFLFFTGLLLLIVTPYIFSAVGQGHGWLALKLLGSDREAELEARVDELTFSRSRALDSAVVDLRRIERDLHDGAQQRLVKLSMDLGLAKEVLDTDPEAAKELIEEAHDESKRAMQEIRNLARGIHPAVLTDRGLSAAVSAIAARSTIPVDLNIALDERLPDRVESGAYFIIAEALTNIARHSQAATASVSIRRFGELLLVDIEDNGVGGADARRGTGLAGIQDRVTALEGRMIVESQTGQGTLIHVELPCGS